MYDVTVDPYIKAAFTPIHSIRQLSVQTTMAELEET